MHDVAEFLNVSRVFKSILCEWPLIDLYLIPEEMITADDG